MKNQYNLKTLCEQVFKFGISFNKFVPNSDVDLEFNRMYFDENLDKYGRLYVIEVLYKKDVYANEQKDIYGNIVFTNYDEANILKNKLVALIEFAKIFVEKYHKNYEEILYKYDTITYTSEEEDELFNAYDYFYEIHRYHSVIIVRLRIDNNDYKLTEYFNKYLTK